jgi:hypothetical protein
VYNSLASASICVESMSRWLMAASCWFSRSSLVSRCCYLACAIALLKVVLLFSMEVHSRRHRRSSWM